MNITLVILAKMPESILNASDEAMYEAITKNGNNDGMTVVSKSVIPFFIPSLAVFGFNRITVIKSTVHNIFGK
ncbi:MAG: hypothetical protein E7557_02015 [Ruminococcaceae bacterium]|nr:hypothetical protein [Oscillospiraceae bacterium]